MRQPQLDYVHCPDRAAGHRMAFWQWGDAGAAQVVVCVHGLSRQGRDFDVLAQALVARAHQKGQSLRVICPDVVGRGQSDWLADPAGYEIPTYAADMLALLAELDRQAPIRTLDWVGTSMGGVIGMLVCGQPGLPLPVPVHKLVLNDVGPALSWPALQRIGGNLGTAGQFADLQQAADRLWTLSSSFGPHTPAQWLALSHHMVKPAVAGGQAGPLVLHYDPAIAVPIRGITEASTQHAADVLWSLYDGIQAQTLLLRGAQSDLLSPQAAQAMTLRGPRARLMEFEGVGHAPTLVAADQVAAVLNFLLDEVPETATPARHEK
jgi:pimeloyl-ACP methyl ester carboxylesterase